MSVLNDPRVTVKPNQGSAPTLPGDVEFWIDVPVPAEVNPEHDGYVVVQVGEGWSSSETRTGWVVFNSFCVWIGSARMPADRENEIDAQDVYPSAEEAVGAVLTALDNA